MTPEERSAIKAEIRAEVFADVKAILKESAPSKAKHGPHAVFMCPVCEEPSRLILEENGVVFTCRPCDVQIRFAASILKKPSVDALLEHGKEEALVTCHGTKELAAAIRTRDALKARDASAFGGESEKTKAVGEASADVLKAAHGKRDEMKRAAIKNGESKS